MNRTRKKTMIAAFAVALALAFAPLVPTTLAQGDEQPDLAPTVLTHEPEAPEPGDLVTFTATVANQGDASAGPFAVEFHVDGTLVSAATVAGVDAGETTEVTSDPWPATEGEHTVTATVDSQGTVDESDEENNVREESLPILPDLVSEDLLPTPVEPDAGDDVTFNVTVHNEGNAAVEEFDVAFGVDGEEISTVTVATVLEPGDNVTVDSQEAWEATLGAHLANATADPDDEINEHDDDNNTVTRDVSLGANLTVAAIQPIPAATEPGEQVVFSATVENDGHDPAGEFRVAFQIGDEDLGHALVSGLGDGDTTTVTSQPWGATEGFHTLTVTADADDTVDETNETDNEATRGIPVGEENLPNLVVRGAEHDPSVPTTDEPVTFETTVTNEGGSAADAFAVEFALEAGGTVDQAFVAEGLEPGESAALTAEPATVQTTGQHAMRVTADPAGGVPEATTADNQAVHTFTVVEPGEDGIESPTPTEDTPGLGAALAALAVAAGLALVRRR